MATKQNKRTPEPHPYTRLPFVFDPPNKRGEPYRLRDFWHVSPNGNYNQECQLGDAFARELLGFMREQNEWDIARYVLLDMITSNGGQRSGIEVGFLGTICGVLLHGITASEPPKMRAPAMMWERQHNAEIAAERAAKRAAKAAAKLATKPNGAGDNQAGRG